MPRQRDKMHSAELPLNTGGGADAGDFGHIVGWWTSTPPVGWLPLDGRSTEGYPVLAAIYGANLPDLRGVPLWGWTASAAPGAIEGDNEASLAHSHTVTASTDSAGAHDHGGATGADGSVSVGPPQLVGNINVSPAGHTHTISSGGAHSHAVTASAGSSLSTLDKRPRRARVMWIVKAG